jgi:ERAP1-like C-terminal domain
LRSILLSERAENSIKKEAQKRFSAWRGGSEAALPPSIRRIVFGIILKNSPTKEDYDAVLDTYRKSGSVDAKEIVLLAIGDVVDPSLIAQTINFILSGEIPSQDIHWPCLSLASNPAARDLWWAAMKANWKYTLSKVLG